MNLNLWKGFDNVVLWGVEHALAYNVLTSLQQQNIYALVTDNDQKQALIEKLKEQDFDAKLSIEQAYLNDKEGKETLREFSLPQFNSLKTATGVFDIYPGLKQVQMQSVHCLSPESLLQRYELSNQAKNVLWLEVNGQITTTIKAIIENQQIYQFATLFLLIPSQPWYESEVAIDKLTDILKNIGYDVFDLASDFDVDQRLYEFIRHPMTLQKNTLETELKDIRLEFAKILDKKAELESHLDKRGVDYKNSQQKQAELIKELTQTKNKSIEQKKELDEYAEQLKRLERDTQTLQSQIEEVSQKNTDLKDQHTKSSQNLEQLKKQAKEAQQSLDDLNLQNLEQYNLLQTECHQAASERDLVREERDSARKERDDLKPKLEHKDKEVATLGKQLNDTQVQLNNAKKQNSSFHSQQAQSIAQQKQLENQLTKAEAQIDIIKELLIKPTSHDK